MKIQAQTGERVIELEIDREDGLFRVTIDGRSFLVDAQRLEGDFYSILTEGRSYEVSVEARRDGYRVRHGAAEHTVHLTDPGRRARDARAAAGPAQILAQMPGRVVRVLVEAGDEVEADQGLLVVEAMKMENEITASKPGKVRKLAVAPGQAVEGGALLVEIE